MTGKLAIFGDSMFHLPYYLRSAIAWALVPAALWSGVQAPECVCASGEHRFFCPKMLRRVFSESTARTEPKHACCAQKAVKQSPACRATASKEGTCPAGVGSTASGPCSQCKAVPSSLAYVADGVQIPSTDWTTWLSAACTVDQAYLVARQADDHCLPASDRLPMTDRVIVLCCLLI